MDKKKKLIRFILTWVIFVAVVNVVGTLYYAAGGRGDFFVHGMGIKDAIKEMYSDFYAIIFLFIIPGIISFEHVCKRKD